MPLMRVPPPPRHRPPTSERSRADRRHDKHLRSARQLRDRRVRNRRRPTHEQRRAALLAALPARSRALGPVTPAQCARQELEAALPFRTPLPVGSPAEAAEVRPPPLDELPWASYVTPRVECTSPDSQRQWRLHALRSQPQPQPQQPVAVSPVAVVRPLAPASPLTTAPSGQPLMRLSASAPDLRVEAAPPVVPDPVPVPVPARARRPSAPVPPAQLREARFGVQLPVEGAASASEPALLTLQRYKGGAVFARAFCPRLVVSADPAFVGAARVGLLARLLGREWARAVAAQLFLAAPDRAGLGHRLCLRRGVGVGAVGPDSLLLELDDRTARFLRPQTRREVCAVGTEDAWALVQRLPESTVGGEAAAGAVLALAEARRSGAPAQS